MVLKNSDGTPYRAVGSIQQFDPENPEHCLFNSWDQEMLRQVGSPLFYYEVMIQVGSLDKLYREDRGKLWSPFPIELFGLYEPVEQRHESGPFGIDGIAEVKFDLNYSDVLQKVGHFPKLGSRIFTPHKRENWVIADVMTGQYKLWGEIRLSIICQRFQESITTGEGRVTQDQPDFKIN